MFMSRGWMIFVVTFVSMLGISQYISEQMSFERLACTSDRSITFPPVARKIFENTSDCLNDPSLLSREASREYDVTVR